MREPRGELIRGVPMSQADTGRHQLRRLAEAGLRVGMLATLTDVDTMEDALAVAELAPESCFARTLAEFSRVQVTHSQAPVVAASDAPQFGATSPR